MDKKTYLLKRKFIALVKKYIVISQKEHYSYMARGCGGKRDWYDIRDKFAEQWDKINTEFKKTFKSMIPKKDYKNFTLSSYYVDIDEVEEMWDCWYCNDAKSKVKKNEIVSFDNKNT